jgi:hypothetical protein
VPLKEISEVVRRLILESIGSVPELEAVLLLRSQRGREWTVEEAGARLYVSPTMAAHVLSQLEANGFLATAAGRYRYAPRNPGLDEAVSELASAYATNLIAVTQLIHNRPNASVLQFAEAFRLRKDS